MTINEFKQCKPKMRTKAEPGKWREGITGEKGTEIS